MTTALPAPNRPTGGVHPDGVEPSRWIAALGLAFLAVGFSIDLVAFSSALALLDDQMPMWLAWVIAVGASLMALFLMFEAGHLEAQRREKTMGRHGRGVIRALIGVWFMAGVGATFIRMTIDHGAPSSDPFGTAGTSGASDPFAAGSADPFSSGATDPFAAADPSGLDLGFATIHYENVPMALFMLVLYMGVGLGAYLYGLRSHNPRLTELRRARRAAAHEAKALARLESQRDDAAASAEALRRVSDEVASHEAEIAALSELEVALVAQLEASAAHRALTDRRFAAQQAQARLATDIAGIPGQVQTEARAAEAAGRSAEQHARTMLHRHLGDPSRTVMDADLADPSAPSPFAQEA